MSAREPLAGKSWPIAGSGDAKILEPHGNSNGEVWWWVQYPNGEKRLVREQVLRRILEQP